MSKKDIIQCILGLTAMIASCAAALWFFTSGYDLVSPRMLYIIKITSTIMVNLIFTWIFGGACYRIFTVVAYKRRFDSMATRIINGAIGVALLVALYFCFEFPTHLIEDIKGIINILFGDGLYY